MRQETAAVQGRGPVAPPQAKITIKNKTAEPTTELKGRNIIAVFKAVLAYILSVILIRVCSKHQALSIKLPVLTRNTTPSSPKNEKYGKNKTMGKKPLRVS